MLIDRQYYAALKGCTGESAGTTALAALVWEGVLYVANAGGAVGISISQCRSPTLLSVAAAAGQQQQWDRSSSSALRHLRLVRLAGSTCQRLQQWPLGMCPGLPFGVLAAA